MFSELFLNNDEVFIFNNVFECACMKSYDDFLINTVKCPKFEKLAASICRTRSQAQKAAQEKAF